MPKLLSRIWLILFLSLVIRLTCTAQNNFFQDKEMVKVLKHSFDLLYNYQFEEAATTILPVRTKYKNYPPVQIFDCLMQYWKNFPVSSHPQQYEEYKESLKTALTTAESYLENDKESAEKIFYCLLLNIMLARQHSEDGNTWRAARYALTAYGYINSTKNDY